MKNKKYHTVKTVPIFTISSVTGKHLDLLTKFLNVLPPMKKVKEREKLKQHHTEYQVRFLLNTSLYDGHLSHLRM